MTSGDAEGTVSVPFRGKTERHGGRSLQVVEVSAIMGSMNILVLTPGLYDTSPGARFRIEQWARYLERDGLEFTFVPFEDKKLHDILYQPGKYLRKAVSMARGFVRRVGVLRTLHHYDAVFLQREAALIGPAIFESLIGRNGPPLIYDFDDPIWLSYRSPMNPLFGRLKCLSKTAAICRHADTVIVGNRLLANWARNHARRVEVIPSTIDLDRYRAKATNGKPRTITLGWTGSHSTLPFLNLLHNVLHRLATKHPFRLLVVSHTDVPPRNGLPVEVIGKRWNAASEAEDLHEMDIGLGPFPNQGWTPWRCHGKILQYMAAGIPTVASPIGIITDYIQDGVTGFLAETEDEWIEKLSILIKNAELRRQMGMAGRRTVEQRYSAQVWAPKVRGIFDSVSTSNEKHPRR